MPVVTPPTITPLPLPPDPTDRSTFDARAYPWSVAQGVLAAEMGPLAGNVYANAQAAEAATTTTGADALAASNSASAAFVSEGKAFASEGKAFTSETNAENSRIQASKLNLGPNSTAPTVDNQGAALLQGATYYDTVLNKWRVWTGAAWGDGITSISGVSTVNGQSGDVVLDTVAEVAAPTNTSPAHAATNVAETPALTGSTFFTVYAATHANSQVQLSLSADFTTPLYDSGDKPGAVSVSVPAATLAVSTTYYWRIRYKNSRGAWSNWSAPTTFVTASIFENYIPTPSATPSIGDSFEGGFYTGMIWNEVMQSATSTTIGTGSKTFTVPSMSITPLVYSGQTLEIRSRANPANKMIGTVSAAGGTTLIVSVASVGGSGTFTDWSVMAQYRCIVSPKSSGQTSKTYKNANTSAPAACGTLTEGRKATLAMVGADSSTVYPAAHWCNDLSIGGKSDWYLPARDELELCWRNLKPVANNNYTTANRSAASPHDYKNLGSYGDTATTHGVNTNSSPTNSAYSTTVPGGTALTVFQNGNTEAFAINSYNYLTSSEFDSGHPWSQSYTSSHFGSQDADQGKTTTLYVRAFRRSII